MWAKKQNAFTIVELLIVIVVIAVLAVITVIAFNGIRDRANDSSAKSSAAQAAKKMEAAKASNGGDYPTSLSAAEIANTNNKLQYTGSATNFCITATEGNKSYKVSESATTPISGGCPGHGQGGVAAITNYYRDPDAAGSISNFGFSGTPAANSKSIATDRSHNGSTSLKTVANATGQLGTAAALATRSLRLSAGQQMSWSFWIYSTKAGNIIPYSDGSRVDNNSYVGCSSSVVSIPANAWTKVNGTCSFGADAYPTQTGGYNLSVVSGDILWTDEFMISEGGSQQTYGDGNFTDWTWNGAANGSTSTGPEL